MLSVQMKMIVKRFTFPMKRSQVYLVEYLHRERENYHKHLEAHRL